MAIAEPAGQLAEMGVEPVVHHHDLASPDERLDPFAVPLRDLLERVAAVVEHVRPVRELGPVAGIHVEQGQAFRLGHLPDQRVDRFVALGGHVGDDRHRDDGRPRIVPAQPADQLGIVLGEVGLELLPLAEVVQAVADEDVIDASEGGDLLVVPAGREQAPDVLAVPPLVDDLTRRQVLLRRQQQPDHVFEVGAVGIGLPADAADGGAVAEEEDLELSRLPAPRPQPATSRGRRGTRFAKRCCVASDRFSWGLGCRLFEPGPLNARVSGSSTVNHPGPVCDPATSP